MDDEGRNTGDAVAWWRHGPTLSQSLSAAPALRCRGSRRRGWEVVDLDVP
jgi:hypothetical protein